jgi:O-antigen/teichoic acid export membrane protein
MNFSAQFSRVAAGVVTGEIPREILWQLAVVAIILGHRVLQTPFTTIEFFVSAAVAIALSIVLQQSWSRVPAAAVTAAKSEYDSAGWIPRSFRMWLSAILDTSSQYLEVIAIGLFSDRAVAAFYFVATRITNVFAMISGSITAMRLRRSATCSTAAKDELQAILRSLAIISAILAAGAFLVIAFGGKLLLWTFGPVYLSAYPALLVLTAGASIGALAGPPLPAAAHRKRRCVPRILACGLLARLALIALLGPWLGLIGAAIAWSVSTIGVASVLVIACRPDRARSFAAQRDPAFAPSRTHPEGSVP